jgi:hypothetical protein
VPATIETIPGAPIIIVHAIPAVDDIMKETVEAIALITAVLDNQTEKVFLIMDLKDISMDLDDVVHVASVSARGSNALLHHPNIRENISVLNDGFIKMAARGVRSATFGQIKVYVFDSVEEALAYCREQLRTPGF